MLSFVFWADVTISRETRPVPFLGRGDRVSGDVAEYFASPAVFGRSVAYLREAARAIRRLSDLGDPGAPVPAEPDGWYWLGAVERLALQGLPGDRGGALASYAAPFIHQLVADGIIPAGAYEPITTPGKRRRRKRSDALRRERSLLAHIRSTDDPRTASGFRTGWPGSSR